MMIMKIQSWQTETSMISKETLATERLKKTAIREKDLAEKLNDSMLELNDSKIMIGQLEHEVLKNASLLGDRERHGEEDEYRDEEIKVNPLLLSLACAAVST